MSRLPAELTTFVGRETELEKVIVLLESSPLVTITGTGGVGKSRLALRAAGLVSDHYADGVVLAKLDTLSDPDLVATAIAGACGLNGADDDPVTALVVHLRGKNALLLLDSCEHGARVCGELARTLLDAAPGVRILATSWWPLDQAGERVLRIEPLAVPEAQDLHEAKELDAVKLFTDRAVAAWPRFVVGADNWAAVVRLCHLLDGIPLAVELAAAWLRVLPLGAILSAMDDGFRLLVRGGGFGPAHQRSLRDTVGRTYELCGPSEQLLWTGLSVFRGTFDLVAAESVCGGEAVGHVLSGLVNKSIVIAERGTKRYRMLDTLRAYGRQQLRSASVDSAFPMRHCDYFVRLAERAEDEWRRGEDRTGIAARIHLELPNLRAALEFCSTTAGQQATGLRLTVLLHFYWLWCGRAAEGQRWVKLALARNPDPGRDWATGSWLASLFTVVAEGPPDPRPARQAEAWALAHGDDRVLGESRLVVAIVDALQGNPTGNVGNPTAAGRAEWAAELLEIGERSRSGHDDALSEVLKRALSGRTSADRTASPLTKRERQVATLAAEGLTNRAIAIRLDIALRTVETHVNRILRKLDLESRTDLAGWQLSAGNGR